MILLTSAGWARLRALLIARADLAAGQRPRRDLPARLTVATVAVRDLAAAEVEASTTSQHVCVLRAAGVVTATREGGAVLYALGSREVVERVGAARRLLSEVLADPSGPLAELRQPPHHPRPG
ncbi:helix-turn-helix domain-containing protein [Nonomuraea sp. NPDC004186]